MFIEQLLSKQYENQNLSDILSQNARNNGDLAFWINDSKNRSAVDRAINTRQSSYQNLGSLSESKQNSMQNSRLRYNYLKSRSKNHTKIQSLKMHNRIEDKSIDFVNNFELNK